MWQILLPTLVMLLLIAVRTRVDTQIHPAQPWVLIAISLCLTIISIICVRVFPFSICSIKELKEESRVHQFLVSYLNLKSFLTVNSIGLTSWSIWEERETNNISFWTYLASNTLFGIMFIWKWNRYIQERMYVEVGSGISPSFQQVLELLWAKGEYLAFAPDTKETEQMIDIISIKFPRLKVTPLYFYHPVLCH